MSRDDFDFSDEVEEFDFEKEANEKTLSFLFDDPRTPASKEVVSQRQRDPRFSTLAREVRKLTSRKRMFLRFLMANQMHMGRAIKAMAKATNQKVEPSSVYRWAREDRAFKKVIEQYELLAVELAGVGSPVTTLLRIDDVIEDALVPVPRIHNGNPVYVDGRLQMEVDRGNALKGLEMLGKSQGVFRKDEEQQQRVTVILDFSGEKEGGGGTESEVIDGDFQEIKR